MPNPALYTVEKGCDLYAIGDVHGHADFLRDMLNLIARRSPGATVVTLGDYCDRGPQTKGVIDILSGGDPRLNVISLIGNHDEWMLNGLRDVDAFDEWLSYGGSAATMRSYGVSFSPESLDALGLMKPARRHRCVAGYAQQFASAVPNHHRSWLERLYLRAEASEAHFVHAGFNPRRPVSKQSVNDMLWIRDGFNDVASDFGKPVYHGHTIHSRPRDYGYRVVMDTGAYSSGILTAAQIGPGGRPKAFLATGRVAGRVVVSDLADRAPGENFRLWASWIAMVCGLSGQPVEMCLSNRERSNYLVDRLMEIGQRDLRAISFEELLHRSNGPMALKAANRETADKIRAAVLSRQMASAP